MISNKLPQPVYYSNLMSSLVKPTARYAFIKAVVTAFQSDSKTAFIYI